MYKYSRDELESLANEINWLDIIPLEQAYVVEKITLLDGTPATVWQITLGAGAEKLTFATSPDKSELYEIKPDSRGRQWSRFDALKHLKFGGDYTKAVQYLTSRIELLDTSLASIGRDLVGERLKDSLEIPVRERAQCDPEFADLVASEQFKMEARDLAKERVRLAALGRDAEPPAPVVLDEFLAQEDKGADDLIAGLAGNGSTIVPFAQAKVGKTTFAVNLIRALADHEPFLEYFATREQAGKVGYMNYELNRDQCRRWFRDIGIRNVDKVVLWNLRGEANPLRSREAMIQFAETHVAPMGVETLIVDPLSGAFTGNTLDNDEVKRFFLQLEEFKVAAGVTNLIVIVHAGNDASRPRGATTLRDHPDALWSLSKDSAGRRYFKAEGRDVDLDEGELLYDATSRRLTFNPGSGRRSSTDGLKSAMLKYIVEHPGCKAKEVDSAFKASKARKVQVRDDLLREGLIEVKDGGRNAKLFYPVASRPVVPEPFPEGGTLEVSSSSSPLSIGGTTDSGIQRHQEHPDSDGDTTEDLNGKPRFSEDWPRLLRVAGY